MITFLRSPASDNAVDDYRIWSKNILPACFGQRRFVKWEVNPNAVYSAINKEIGNGK
jgi:hypothetical protein